MAHLIFYEKIIRARDTRTYADWSDTGLDVDETTYRATPWTARHGLLKTYPAVEPKAALLIMRVISIMQGQPWQNYGFNGLCTNNSFIMEAPVGANVFSTDGELNAVVNNSSSAQDPPLCSLVTMAVDDLYQTDTTGLEPYFMELLDCQAEDLAIQFEFVPCAIMQFCGIDFDLEGDLIHMEGVTAAIYEFVGNESPLMPSFNDERPPMTELCCESVTWPPVEPVESCCCSTVSLTAFLGGLVLARFLRKEHTHSATGLVVVAGVILATSMTSGSSCGHDGIILPLCAGALIGIIPINPLTGEESTIRNMESAAALSMEYGNL